MYRITVDGHTLERRSSRTFTHAIVRRYSDATKPGMSLASSEERAENEAATQRRLAYRMRGTLKQIDVMPVTPEEEN